MPRRLPVLALTAGCTLALFGLVRVVRGQGTEAAPAKAPAGEFPRVRVEFADKTRPGVEGVLRLPAVEVRTATDARSIDLRHVRRVSFPADRAAEGQDAVELDGKEVVRGAVTTAEFPVEVGGTVTAYPRADLREVRVIREASPSLLAVLFGLVTLSVMEIVLGIDNIIFLAIVAARLPKEQQPRARKIGLAAALGTRILLLFTLSFLLGLTAPLFVLPDLPLLHHLEAREVSGRDLILFLGGLFLIYKSVREMHKKLEETKEARAGDGAGPAGGPAAGGGAGGRPPAGFAGAIATIAVIDIVFSLDSVITAIGMVDQIWVMVVAMVIAMLVMWRFSGPVSEFVDDHPTVKVLALAFLILIGVMLVAEALGQHIDKGYIYFAMAFAVAIELVNLRLRGTSTAKAAATAELPAGRSED
jgi:predicted tellurium resistance membrane protein TerC